MEIERLGAGVLGEKEIEPPLKEFHPRDSSPASHDNDVAILEIADVEVPGIAYIGFDAEVLSHPQQARGDVQRAARLVYCLDNSVRITARTSGRRYARGRWLDIPR